MSPFTSYASIILRNQSAETLPDSDDYEVFAVNNQFRILYTSLPLWQEALPNLSYFSIPKLFTYTDTASLESSGITQVQYQPFLNLLGSNVLVGFLDSGINYLHPAFRNTDGSTRILRLWDQTAADTSLTSMLPYGKEYREEDLNQALFSSDPLSIVPVTDPDGHGTAVCGIACGSSDSSEDFTGAAPLSNILFVKLRPARAYLTDYYIVPSGAPAFQEDDLMTGIRYLTDTAKELGRPLVICISMGSNQGGHTGMSSLEETLTLAQFYTGVYCVAGTGNEAAAGHHYRGNVSSEGDSVEVELLVEEQTPGFTLEFWADAPELYSIGFTSPLGETISPFQPRFQSPVDIPFLLESSKITLSSFPIETLSGSQTLQIRFQTPTPGLWRLQIVNRIRSNGVFHLWLPISGLVSPGIRFFSPDVNTTLVTPSTASTILSCSTYDVYSKSIFIRSGRGFTRNNIRKPDFAAPGINLTAPGADSGYRLFSGSSAAAALTAGAAALLVESGLKNPVPRIFTAQEILSLFLRGATRNPVYEYPNPIWGFGTLDLYGIFSYFLQN